jgi:hypothetical protein
MNKMIKKIELDLGGKTVNLTPEQAKNLKEALDELFGKTIIKEIHEYHDPYYWKWTQPYKVTFDTGGNYTDTMKYCAGNGTLRLTA